MENQPESFLVELVRYNNWANAQVFAACRELTEEQVAATTPGAYGNIRDTLMHMIWAEADYIGRMTGDRPYPSFRRDDPYTVADIAEFAGRVGPALLEAVQRVPLAYIVHEEEDGNTVDYQARGLFIQVINHGIEHRTNVTTILSGLGLSAPEVDGWGYMSAYPERFELKESSQ
jgi:uncharacterized damage-inducible protein DinB